MFASFFVCLVALASHSGAALSLAEASSGGSLGEKLVEGALALVASAVAYFATVWLRAAAKKAGVEVDAEEEKKLREGIKDAILWVAERAGLVEKLGKKISSEEKLEMAATKLLEKHPKLTRAEAKEMIETRLAEVGQGSTFPSKANPPKA